MAKKPEYPFSDFDFSKMLSEFKLPMVDTEALMTAQRRNIEALTEANRLAAEGFQAVAKRQAEILRDTLSEAVENAKSFTSSPSEYPSKQAELIRKAMESAIANMRELAELATKANSEVFDVINKRVMANIEELRGAAKGAKP